MFFKKISDSYLLSAYLTYNEEFLLSCKSNDPKISLWDLKVLTCTQYLLPNRLIDSKQF